MYTIWWVPDGQIPEIYGNKTTTIIISDDFWTWSDVTHFGLWSRVGVSILNIDKIDTNLCINIDR